MASKKRSGGQQETVPVEVLKEFREVYKSFDSQQAFISYIEEAGNRLHHTTINKLMEGTLYRKKCHPLTILKMKAIVNAQKVA